jgi:hypothetical protein
VFNLSEEQNMPNYFHSRLFNRKTSVFLSVFLKLTRSAEAHTDISYGECGYFQELMKKKKGEKVEMTKKERETMQAQLEKESEIRARLEQVNHKPTMVVFSWLGLRRSLSCVCLILASATGVLFQVLVFLRLLKLLFVPQVISHYVKNSD